MTPNLKGSLKLYAANGIGTFDHIKTFGQADTINLPAGDYQIEMTDGVRKGSGDLRIPPKAVALLTEDDIDWAKPVNTSMEIKSKGGAVKILRQRILSVAIGSHVAAKTIDGELALQSNNDSTWLNPRISFDYSTRTPPSSDDKYKENDDLYSYSNQNDPSKFVESYGPQFGLCIPLISLKNINERLFLIPSIGVKKASFIDGNHQIVEQSITGKAEILADLFSHKLLVSIGIERYFTSWKSELDNEPSRQLLIKVGSGLYNF
jgi:hypothetical protein